MSITPGRDQRNGSSDERFALRDIRKRYQLSEEITQQNIEQLRKIIAEGKSERNRLMALRLWMDLAKHVDTIEMKLFAVDKIQSHTPDDARVIYEGIRKMLIDGNDPDWLETERNRATALDSQPRLNGSGGESGPLGNGQAP